MKRLRKNGQVPHYWWDFDDHGIVIETDDPRVPGGVIKRFTGKQAIVANAIELVDNLKAGRVKISDFK